MAAQNLGSENDGVRCYRALESRRLTGTSLLARIAAPGMADARYRWDKFARGMGISRESAARMRNMIMWCSICSLSTMWNVSAEAYASGQSGWIAVGLGLMALAAAAGALAASEAIGYCRGLVHGRAICCTMDSPCANRRKLAVAKAARIVGGRRYKQKRRVKRGYLEASPKRRYNLINQYDSPCSSCGDERSATAVLTGAWWARGRDRSCEAKGGDYSRGVVVRSLGALSVLLLILCTGLATRMGEADKPGPLDDPDVRWMEMAQMAWRQDHRGSNNDDREQAATGYRQGPRTLSSNADFRPAAFQYPQPGGDGFRRVVALGVATRSDSADDLSQPKEGEFALCIETVNGNGWRAIRERLESTSAHIVCAQETWVLEQDIGRFSMWAKRKGWKSVWEAANRRKEVDRGASGGVAIFVRDEMGIRYPSQHGTCWYPARAVAAVVEAPGMRPLLIVSCYGKHGGWNSVTSEVLHRIAINSRDQDEGLQTLVAGDFNCPPADVTKSGTPELMEAVVVAPNQARGTFRTKKSRSLLDYFIVADSLSKLVTDIRTIEDSTVKGHTPVQMQFMAQATAWRALDLRHPPRIPTQRIIGPLRPAPSYDKATRLVLESASAHGAGKRRLCQEKLDEAYQEWANMAEWELSTATGFIPPVWGQRGQGARVTWRSVLPEKPRQTNARNLPRAATIAELRRMVIEAVRISKAAENEDDISLGNGAKNQANHPILGEDADEDERERLMEDAVWWCEMGQRLDELIVDKRLDGDIRQMARDVRTFMLERERWEPGIELHRYEVWHSRGESLINQLRTHAGAQEKQDSKEGFERWQQWISHNISRGARNAHRYLRGEKAWVPSATSALQGEPVTESDDEQHDDNPRSGGRPVVSAAPRALLEDQLYKWARKWEASERAFVYNWKTWHEGENDRDSNFQLVTPSPLDAERLTEAAASFRTTTASTYDGFHVSHFRILGTEAMSALAEILNCVEQVGSWPSQIRTTTMPLLPKAKSGFRVIGIIPSVVRLWAKARREVADRWEAASDRPFFAAARGNSPIDTVWRQACRQEAKVSQGHAAVIVLEDLASFYEGLDRGVLMAEAEAVGFPVAIAKAAMEIYAGPRVITMNGIMSRAVYPRKGIIAGCSLATSFVRVYMVRAIDELKPTLPEGVSIDIFIDDIAISAEGPKNVVVAKIAEARRIIKRAMIEKLGCKFAEEKTAVVASSRAVAKQVARECGITSAITGIATNLGIDATAGKQVGATRSTASALSKRGRALKAKRKRIATLRKAAAGFSCKVFVAGPLAAASYGTEVWGASDACVRNIRQAAGRSIKPAGRTRSLRTALLLAGMPTARTEVGPIVQLSRMVWKGVTERLEAERRECSLTTILRWWYASEAYITDILEPSEGSIGTDAQAWRKVRGPMAAAALTAKRIGWQMVSPILFMDDRGIEVRLTDTSPAMMKALLHEGVCRSVERQIAVGHAHVDEKFKDRRICIDMVKRACNNTKRLTPKERGAVKAVACGGVMTNKKAFQLGYETENKCPLCGATGDSVRHRTFCCPATAEAVHRVAPQWIIDEAVAADDDDVFWNSAIFPHPADLAELPAVGGELFGEEVVNGAWTRTEDWRGWADGWGSPFCGWLYGDGSCDTSPIAELRRAACAVVQVDNDGNPMRRISAVIPRSLPQTPQAGEYVAAGLAIMFANDELTYVGDCKGVVRDLMRPVKSMISPLRKYAGVLMHTLALPEQRARLQGVEWMPSHLALQQGASDKDRRNHAGNMFADLAAKEARMRHPPLGELVTKESEYYIKRAPFVARAIGVAMALFPPRDGRLKRAIVAERGAATRTVIGHQWVFQDGAWRCTECGTWKRSEGKRPSGGGQCKGWISKNNLARVVRSGHRLNRAEGDHGLIFCAKCGAFATRRLRKLGASCKRPTAAGYQALKRIAGGNMPWQRRTEGLRGLPRGKIKCVATFDQISLKWKHMVGARGNTHSHVDREQVPSVNVATTEPTEDETAEANDLPAEIENRCFEQEFDAEMEAALAMGNLGPMNSSEGSIVMGTKGNPKDTLSDRTLEDVRGEGAGGVDDANADPTHSGQKKKRQSVEVARREVRRRIHKQTIEDIGKRLTKSRSDAAERLEDLRSRVQARAKETRNEKSPSPRGEGGGHHPQSGYPQKDTDLSAAAAVAGRTGAHNGHNTAARSECDGRVASCLRQPMDGHCMFHSVNVALSGRTSLEEVFRLRRGVACYMTTHSDSEFGESSLAQWVMRETGKSVAAYARRMARGGWGGAIELAAIARWRNCCIKVFTACREGQRADATVEDGTPIRTIATFGNDRGGRADINLLFVGGAHYDALQWGDGCGGISAIGQSGERQEFTPYAGLAATVQARNSGTGSAGQEIAASGNPTHFADRPQGENDADANASNGATNDSDSGAGQTRHWTWLGHGKYDPADLKRANRGNPVQKTFHESTGLPEQAHKWVPQSSIHAANSEVGSVPKEESRRRIRGKRMPMP